MNEYKLIFDQEQLATINRALQEMPYRIAAPLIDNINEQLSNRRADNDDNESKG